MSSLFYDLNKNKRGYNVPKEITIFTNSSVLEYVELLNQNIFLELKKISGESIGTFTSLSGLTNSVPINTDTVVTNSLYGTNSADVIYFKQKVSLNNLFYNVSEVKINNSTTTSTFENAFTINLSTTNSKKNINTLTINRETTNKNVTINIGSDINLSGRYTLNNVTFSTVPNIKIRPNALSGTSDMIIKYATARGTYHDILEKIAKASVLNSNGTVNNSGDPNASFTVTLANKVLTNISDDENGLSDVYTSVKYIPLSFGKSGTGNTLGNLSATSLELRKSTNYGKYGFSASYEVDNQLNRDVGFFAHASNALTRIKAIQDVAENQEKICTCQFKTNGTSTGMTNNRFLFIPNSTNLANANILYIEDPSIRGVKIRYYEGTGLNNPFGSGNPYFEITASSFEEVAAANWS